LQRRIKEHKSKLIEGFSKKYNCIHLIYFEKHNQIENAILREKQLKKWKREWKENLINSEIQIGMIYPKSGDKGQFSYMLVLRFLPKFILSISRKAGMTNNMGQTNFYLNPFNRRIY
jgi:hypothetical protein